MIENWSAYQLFPAVSFCFVFLLGVKLYRSCPIGDKGVWTFQFQITLIPLRFEEQEQNSGIGM